jgi:hypothetical protein
VGGNTEFDVGTLIMQENGIQENDEGGTCGKNRNNGLGRVACR